MTALVSRRSLANNWYSYIQLLVLIKVNRGATVLIERLFSFSCILFLNF